MATAAKKPAGTPASSSAKKPAAKVRPAPVKAPAAKAPASKPAAAKAAPVKAAPARQAAKPAPAAPAKPAQEKTLKKTGGKPVMAQASPVAKPAPAGKASAPKPKAAAPAQASAKPAPKQAAPAKAPAKAAARPAAASAPQKPMKATETKSTPAKAAKKAAGTPITEAEILAMSDKDYMNDVQLAFFKAKLEAMRDEILENARETGEHLKENEVFADPNDRATVEEENLLEQRVRDRERKLLKKINASLARIEEGAYGYCLETGDPIGIPRLLARPTAELSIEAQEKHERLEKLYAD